MSAPQTARSRITNGADLLAGIDGRTALARRFRDLIAGLQADLGAPLSEAERLQIRTAAGLQLHAEQLTAAVVRGELVDAETITRAGNAATRALAILRRAKPGKPGAPGRAALDVYLAGRGQAA